MKGGLFLIVMGVVVAGVGALFVWLMWGSYKRAVDQRGWTQVEGVVLSSEVEEWKHDDFSPMEYRLKILYGYEWKGERRTGQNLGVRGNPKYNKRGKIEAMTKEYEVGKRVAVYLNPNNEAETILKPDTKAAGYSLWFPLLFVVGGLGMVLGALRKISKARSPDVISAT